MFVYPIVILACIGSVITGLFSMRLGWIILGIPSCLLIITLIGLKLRQYNPIPALSPVANSLFVKYGHYYQHMSFCQTCSSSATRLAVSAIILSIIGICDSQLWYILTIIIAIAVGIYVSKEFSPKNFLHEDVDREAHNEIIKFMQDSMMTNFRKLQAERTNQSESTLTATIPNDEYVTTFFKDTSEYLRFITDLKEAGRASNNATCLALLKKVDNHFLYMVTKDGADISEHVKPFRPNEENISKFNEGCMQCAQLLSLYLRTRDLSIMPKIKPFGDLTWSESDSLNRINEKVEQKTETKYFPTFQDARVTKTNDSESKSFVLMTDINAVGHIKYHHALTVVDKVNNEILLLVTAEAGTSDSTGSPVCFLGAFTGKKHLNFGIHEDCLDLAVFEKKAQEIAKEQLIFAKLTNSTIGEEL